jgi:hypothetical protein
MIGLVAAFLVGATSATTPAHCELRRLEACPTTNPLVWDSAFRMAVRRLVGQRRVAWLYQGRADDQVLDALGGPPDEPTRIGARYRFTACRLHSCTEKGAAVLEPDGRLVAAAILHSECALPNAGPQCFAKETLTVFVRNPRDETQVIANLTAWAQAVVNAELPFGALQHSELVVVEVIAGPAEH